MRVVVLLLLCFRTCLTVADQKRGFLVAAPNTFLSDSVESVCMSLHNSRGPALVTITLTGAFSGEVLSKTSANISDVKCMDLRVSPSADQEARLLVRLESADDPDLTSNSEVLVKLQADPLIVLVSTDKPLYKPGQEVKFRVVSLSHKLKPYNQKISKIWIETPSGIRVEQWTNVEVVDQGLAQFQFILDKEPFLGKWKIKVQPKATSEAIVKTFTVKEFVPTTFKVVISPPKEILPDSGRVSWKICAKYSYGEVVQGDVLVEIKLEGSIAADQPKINNAVKLGSYTGCAEVTVSGAELGLADPFVRPRAILVTATVTERASNVAQAASARSPVHDQPFHLAFQCSQYFKPGLPYKGNVLVKTMNGRLKQAVGERIQVCVKIRHRNQLAMKLSHCWNYSTDLTPQVLVKTMDGRLKQAVGERIQVCVKIRHRNQLAMKLSHCWNYTTDLTSQVVFALPDIEDPLNVQLISLTATAVDRPTKLYPGSAEVMMLQPSVAHTVKPWFSPSHSYVDVSTRTSLACGTTHFVSVYYSVASANQTMPQFYYLVESRGDLVALRSVVPVEETVVHRNEVTPGTGLVRGWRLALAVTPDMAPASRVTVYYVRVDGEVVGGSAMLVVDKCFQNKVRVRWRDMQLRPRQQTQLHVRASPHSTCGVTVTDRQVGYDAAADNTDTATSVWDGLARFRLPKTPRDHRQYCINKVPKEEELPPTYELRRKRFITMPPKDFAEHVDAITAFDDLGVTVLSNLILETRPCSKSIYPNNMVLVTQSESVFSVSDDSIQALVRDHFPDTWVWSLAYTGKEGEVVMNVTAPDSITSWDTEVTCISEKDGFGASHPTSVTVFLPFFVHIEAPYSIKMNEKVMVKIVVYNYMHHSLPVELKVLRNDYVEVEPDSARLCLQPVSPQSVLVSVSPTLAGTANLIVQAKVQPFDGCDSPDLPPKSDTIVKQLTIKHEGYLEQKSYSAFICPSVQSDASVLWDFALPPEDNLVSGSARLQFSVVADLFGPAFENLDSLVLLPMGCGEQNLARLAPNLYVLKYLKAIGNNNEQLKANAVKNIKKGYQRQLMFQRSDGSFSPFGDKDETGSMWLTAAVVRTLSEARDFVEVDPKVLQDAVTWISRQQLENGCFPAVGQLFHAEKQDEDIEESVTTLSALVLASLPGTPSSAVRTNGEFCLKAAAASSAPRLLALAALALSRLGSRERAAEALQTLRSLAVTENDLTHWGTPDDSMPDNIVTSSYAVLALVETGGAENMLMAGKAVRWISTHRNENGGLISTQDTVVALEALTSYAAALPQVNRTELIVFTRGLSRQPQLKTFRLSEDNKLVQQRLVTTEVPKTLSVAVVGEGCALVQSVLKYNVHRPEEGTRLELRVTSSPVSTVDPCAVRELRICTSAVTAVRMALLTVMMITGYSADKAQLQLFSHPHVKRWEDEGDQLVFYLTDVTSVPVCVTVRLVRNHDVEDALPATVTVIDYYCPELTTSESYSFQCSPVAPLDEPSLSDAPVTDRFDNFHNVDFDLETPDGEEGPKPVYASSLTFTKPVNLSPPASTKPLYVTPSASNQTWL